MPTTSNKKGFTLLELLVAVALLALLAAAVYGTFFSIMRGREAAAEGAEERRELRSTLDLLRREISSVFYKPNTNANTNANLKFVVEDKDSFGKPASVLTMTVITPFPGGTAPCSDVQEVIYKPVERDGKIVLTRAAREVVMTGEPISYPQMDEVEGFLVECSNGTKWVKSWDTELNRRLPQAVRITITVKQGNEKVDYSAIVKPRITP